MKLCVPIPCFYKGDFCTAIRRIALLGYRAVETYSWESLDAPSVRAVCDETGVKLLSVCTTDFRLTEPSARPDFLLGLEKSCAAAVALGASRLITQVGQDTGEERALQHESIVEGLRASVPILEKYGTTLMIEPLNTIVDHKGYYLWSAYEGFDIVKEVDHPLVRVVYDIYHQQVMEGNIIPTVTKNIDLIAHLHAAAHPGRCDLWLGECDYHNIFDAVDACGYTGYCGLEYRPVADAEQSLREAMARYGT